MGIGVTNGNISLTVMGAAAFVSGYLHKDYKTKGIDAFF